MKISTDKLCELTQLTAAKLKKLAADGYFPASEANEYEMGRVLHGLFRYYKERDESPPAYMQVMEGQSGAAEDLVRSRQGSLLQKWASGSKLSSEEVEEIAHLIPKKKESTPTDGGGVDFSRLKKTQLAEAFGVDLKTLTRWQSSGLPFIAGESGMANLYNLRDCIKWYVMRESGKLDPNAEKAALVREQAEAARRKNAMAKGEVISVVAVKDMADRWCSAMRQKIMQSRLGRAEKQAILADLRGMKGHDYREITPDDEETAE